MSNPSSTSLKIVHEYLSSERLSTYLRACDHELASALRLYAWNTLVAGAFWEVIGHFEIILRNSLDGRLAYRHARLGRSGDWLDGSVPELGRQTLKDIDKARARVRVKGKRLCHGQIIAELPLGFWRYLLAKQYQTTLWPDLAGAFPHKPDRSMSSVELPVHRIYDLRNRIAHHERIWSLPLEDRYRDILVVLGYIDPEMRAWVEKASRVPQVLAARPRLTIFSN